MRPTWTARRWACARCASWSRLAWLTLLWLLLPAGLAAQDTPAAASDVREELTRIMAQLATSAERTTMGGRMGYAGDSLPDVINLCRVVRMLAALPAAERYEVLKQWMLPSGSGALQRHAMCFAPVEVPPEFLFSAITSATGARQAAPAGAIVPGSDGVIYFSEFLVNAAAECGKLDELAEASASIDKSPHMADTLSILASLALKRDDQLAQQTAEFVETLRQKARTTGQLRLESWPTYMVARAWMRDEAFARQGEALASLLAHHVSGPEQRPFVSHLHRDLASFRVRQCGGTLAAGADPGLALWHPGGYYFTSGSQAGTWPGWWVESNGAVAHLSGPEVSPLYFDCPLAGEFELSLDAYCGTGAEAAVQYGRFVFEPFGRDNKSRVLTIGERQSWEPPNPQCVPDSFNRVVIRVTPEKISYLCNGIAVFEDSQPSLATPWLALLGRCTRRTAWGALQLTGNPRVLREVNLIQGDRMDGWMSPLYRENVPQQLQAADPGARGATDSAPGKQNYIWHAADGVLHGLCMKSPNRNLVIQSWLAYHRPLRTGDVLSYEFYFEPDEKLVHPAFGRTAILLEPDAVRLHWITDVPHMALGGLSADNAVTVAQAQRGPRPLPLKSNAWNTLSIQMADNTATLVLNGTEIYVHDLSDTDQRMFGLFRYKNRTAAEVRRMTLRGNWPENLSAEQMDHPTARAVGTESVENQRSREALVEQAGGNRR